MCSYTTHKIFNRVVIHLTHIFCFDAALSLMRAHSLMVIKFREFLKSRFYHIAITIIIIDKCTRCTAGNRYLYNVYNSPELNTFSGTFNTRHNLLGIRIAAFHFNSVHEWFLHQRTFIKGLWGLISGSTCPLSVYQSVFFFLFFFFSIFPN